MKLLLDDFWVLRNRILAERRQGCLHARDTGCQNSGTAADRRTGGADLQRRQRSGHFCVAAARQDACRAATNLPPDAVAGSFHSFGDDSAIPETVGTSAPQEAWSQGGTCWRTTSASRADRSSRGTPRRGLSVLQRELASLQRDSHPICRRHPVAGTASAPGYGTHNPPRLVPKLPETSRTESPERSAGRDTGQPRACAGRMAALRLGQYALPNHRSVQFPSATENLCGRSGADVLPLAGNSLRLVRANSAASAELGRVARRRKRLACEWQNTLAVVLCDARSDVLHDRPLPRSTRVDEVFYPGIRRNTGQRLLGRVQRGGLRAAPNVPGSSAARFGACRAVQAAGQGLGAVRQEAAASRARRDPVVAAPGEAGGGAVRCAPQSSAPPVAATDRDVLGRFASAAAGQAVAASSERSVYVRGSTGGAVRQQCGRACDPPRSDYPQEQLRQPQRTWCGRASGADECLPHSETTRPRSPPNGGPIACDLLEDRTAPIAARHEKHFRRLNCYYFSKTHPLDKESGEYVATTVHQFADTALAEGTFADCRECQVVDVFAGEIYSA